MSVRITTMNTLNPMVVPGDLIELTNVLENVSARGMEFAVIENDEGRKVAFRWENITTMEEFDDDNTFIGR